MGRLGSETALLLTTRSTGDHCQTGPLMLLLARLPVIVDLLARRVRVIFLHLAVHRPSDSSEWLLRTP